MKKDIINIIKEILFSRNEIIAAFIYGSFLYTEDYDDIDVGVFTNCSFHGLEKPDYEFELEQLLSKKLTGSKIDLRVINNTPDKFLYNVFKGYYLFSKDEKIEKIIEHVIQKSLDQQYYQIQYVQQAYGV
jgi:predicted nucleotidyltransferase